MSYRSRVLTAGSGNPFRAFPVHILLNFAWNRTFSLHGYGQVTRPATKCPRGQSVNYIMTLTWCAVLPHQFGILPDFIGEDRIHSHDRRVARLDP